MFGELVQGVTLTVVRGWTISVSAMIQNQHLTALKVFETHYLDWSPDLSERSQLDYRMSLQRWAWHTPDPDIRAITTETCSRFRRASVEAGHAPCTTEKTLRTLRCVLRCAAAHGLIDHVPDTGKPRRQKRPDPRPPTWQEFAAMYREAGQANWPPERNAGVSPSVFWRSWMVVAVWTGFRLEDLTWRLSTDHIRGYRLEMSADKTERVHRIPIREVVKGHIEAMGRESGPIFGPSNNANRARRELAAIAEAAKISRKITTKSFRQAAVTRWGEIHRDAGHIIHGSGLSDVMLSYVDSFAILSEFADEMNRRLQDAINVAM